MEAKVRELVVGMAIICVAGVALAQPKGAAPDAANGQAIAERWCQDCHIVAEGQNAATDNAPSFPKLAADPARSEEYLRAFLLAPRHPMPPLELSAEQIEDVLAYFGALRDAQ